jgi:hypothetical protein
MDLCSNRETNTGTGSCDGILGTPRYVIAVPKNSVITEQDAGNLLPFLKEKARAASPLVRWYPLMTGVANVTNNSTEPLKATLGQETRKVGSGNAIFLFEYWNSICNNRITGKFDGYSGGAYIVTEYPEKRILGCEDGNGGLFPVRSGGRPVVSQRP